MKNKIITYSFIVYLVLFLMLHILFKDTLISNEERRKLATFPNFEFTTKYITKIEKYLLDQFPFRTHFRSIKAKFNYNIMGRYENNNIFIKDGGIYKSNYPTSYKDIDKFINKINTYNDLLTKNNKKYIMIIPDKNYYLNEKNFLHLDYDYIYNELDKIDATKIDIRNIMTLDDYYKTDTHWKQEKLDKVIKHMSKIMDFKYKNIEYKNNIFNKFYGVYYGESATKMKPEILTYLTNETIENTEVKYLENIELTKIYNTKKLNGMDAYEVYLDGASSFIEITNKQSKTQKELVIFRDSFGSSISPLLVEYYSKITLIDNRYITLDFIEKQKLIEFTNQDILYLYSTLIVNQSSTLKG